MAPHDGEPEINLGGDDSEPEIDLREAAARIDFNWEGAGASPGVEIWRVENKRTEAGNPDFGIAPWPTEKYGQFHRGDSYIVLVTTKDPVNDKLSWDIYFWIGSESSQDEYGVAAYKTIELDQLLGDEPIQHREVEGRESAGFANSFPRGITYLEGGIDSGFRKVGDIDDGISDIRRLYRVHKMPGQKTTRCFEVPLSCSSLNDGDAFLLDAGDRIYTWFGSSVSGFEKAKSALVAHNLKEARLKVNCECILDVMDGNEEFWELLGGKGEIKPAEEAEEAEPAEKKMVRCSFLWDVIYSVHNTCLKTDYVTLVSHHIVCCIRCKWRCKGERSSPRPDQLDNRRCMHRRRWQQRIRLDWEGIDQG